MNEVEQRYSNTLKSTQSRAQVMRSVLIKPISHSNAIARNDAILKAAENEPLFSAMGDHRDGILLSATNAIIEYAKEHNGLYPTDDMLASAHEQWENLYESNDAIAAASKSNLLLSSVSEATLSSEQGVAIRATTAALTLPTILSNPMNAVCTYLPSRKYGTEVFNIDRHAGATLGDYKKGDKIDALTVGQYSRQRQAYDFASAQQPNGTKKNYIFTAKTDTPAKIDTPLRNGSIVIRLNQRIVARQTESGDIYGKTHIGETAYTFTGTAELEKGAISIETNAPLPTDTKLRAQYEIQIEGHPEMIPTVTHKMTSFKIYPHARVLSSDTSAMANFAMNVEFGVDMYSLNLSSIRDEMVNEKAKYQLWDLMQEATETALFNAQVPDSETWKDRFEYFLFTLIKIDTQMKKLNKESGVKAVYAGTNFSAFLQSMPPSIFQRSPTSETTPRIHKIGTLLNRIELFEVPMDGLVPTDQALFCGRTEKIGKAPYLTGDVIPPTIFKSDSEKGLVQSQTIWAQGYDETAPDCWKYLVKVILQNFTLS